MDGNINLLKNDIMKKKTQITPVKPAYVNYMSDIVERKNLLKNKIKYGKLMI